MNLTEEQLENVRIWGRNCISPEKMAIMLQLSRSEREFFMLEFDNTDSQIRTMWEDGRVKAEIEVMESLEAFSMMKEEGSGEAAKSLAWMKSKQNINQLKANLFGI